MVCTFYFVLGLAWLFYFCLRFGLHCLLFVYVWCCFGVCEFDCVAVDYCLFGVVVLNIVILLFCMFSLLFPVVIRFVEVCGVVVSLFFCDWLNDGFDLTVCCLLVAFVCCLLLGVWWYCLCLLVLLYGCCAYCYFGCLVWLRVLVCA